MNYIRRQLWDPDRPVQVTYAVYILYAFVAISFLIYFVRSFVFLFSLPEEYSLSNFIFDLLANALSYMLMFFVAMKIAAGRNWARWLLLIGLVLFLMISLCNMRELVLGDAVSGILNLSQVLVSALAVALLFQRSSNVWFTNRENIEKLDEVDEAPTPPLEPTKDRKNTKIWLIVSQLVSGFLLIPWFAFLLFAGMVGWPVVFEQEGWDLSAVMFSLLIFYPVFSVPFFIAAWYLYAKFNYRWAAIASITPILLVIIIFTMWIVGGYLPLLGIN